MPEGSVIISFAIASYILIVIPGPAVFYILARTINQGKKAGIVSVIGVALGAFVHIIAAILGISAILSASAIAYSILKYAGAAYLLYLGLKTLFSWEKGKEIVVKEKSRKKIFKEAVLVNILNPKAALFFMAFLPQFTNPALGSISSQILVLGLVFVLIAIISDSIYVIFASAIRTVLNRSEFFTKFQRYFSGFTYILLGLSTALSGNNIKK